MSIFKQQADFMRASGQRISETPRNELDDEAWLWFDLIREEFDEFDLSVLAGELSVKECAEICAEAIDLIYVLSGFLNSMGYPAEEMFNAIHEANMRKVGADGKVIRRADGKILKPAGWMPADKEQVMRNASLVPSQDAFTFDAEGGD